MTECNKVRLISLGCQCSVAHGMHRARKRTEAFPFDGILSYLQEVTRILDLVISSPEDAQGLVGTEFYRDLVRSHMNPGKLECYKSEPLGGSLTDASSRITFPHDTDQDNAISRFRRRMTRMQLAIQDAIQGTDHIVFMYADPGSENVSYQYNGELLADANTSYNDLLTLANMLDSHGVSFKLIYFTYNHENIAPSHGDPRIHVIRFQPRDHWFAASDGVYYGTMHIEDLLEAWWPGSRLRNAPLKPFD